MSEDLRRALEKIWHNRYTAQLDVLLSDRQMEAIQQFIESEPEDLDDSGPSAVGPLGEKVY